MRRTIPALLPAVLVLAGCGDDPQPQQQQPPPATDAREHELRKARALDAVGYDGEALERQLRQTIATQEEQQKRLDEAAKAAGNH
jgi:hypothetical protein